MTAMRIKLNFLCFNNLESVLSLPVLGNWTEAVTVISLTSPRPKKNNKEEMWEYVIERQGFHIKNVVDCKMQGENLTMSSVSL